MHNHSIQHLSQKRKHVFCQCFMDLLKLLIFFQGGVIGVFIDWECDLDWGTNSCKPEYWFSSLDVDGDGASGFNYRLVDIGS